MTSFLFLPWYQTASFCRLFSFPVPCWPFRLPPSVVGRFAVTEQQNFAI
jgi:hypothetical protein